jgi:hypothetical protein
MSAWLGRDKGTEEIVAFSALSESGFQFDILWLCACSCGLAPLVVTSAC